MANTNNKQANGFLSSAFGVAKKFSGTGLELANHVAPDSVAKVTQAFNINDALEGAAKQKSPFEAKKYNDPQQMLKEHLPSVSRQLLGRHYNKLNNVAHFVSPQLSDKVTDYFFEHLNDFTNQMSSVDAILDEAGVRDLEELTQDVDRSKRIAQALSEQNKWIATIQGAITSVTGIVGTAVDIPASLVLALRTIYQVGRSYGFDLSKTEDQEIIQYIFKQIDLSLIAEKQAVLLGIKALGSTLKTHDLTQLQNMLGSSNDTESIKNFISSLNLQEKWQWLNQVPKLSLLDQLSKLAPIASAGVGVVYSRRFVEEVNTKAQEVFSHARQYFIQHRDSSLSTLAAYEKSVEQLLQATPKLLDSLKSEQQELSEPILDQDIEIKGNETISQVKLVKKTDSKEREQTESKEEKVGEGLDALVEKHVEPVAEKQVQQPALSSEPDELQAEEDLVEDELDTEHVSDSSIQAQETDSAKPKKAKASDTK
ncbi:EcsC family protein [Acinetobacter sp. NCu2D-2]|uniref:EcsC family protein n=1 Tax=Acinetobacter sp. NCu2D-2 TaxID=1608473 RepID=UPI0007CDFE71|nr:EcsC family protein [Acinetobacter sp. NCu2D-2]ANF81188.1 EcsC family protein [Acinetobacter sp. NCu2D-2]